MKQNRLRRLKLHFSISNGALVSDFLIHAFRICYDNQPVLQVSLLKHQAVCTFFIFFASHAGGLRIPRYRRAANEDIRANEAKLLRFCVCALRRKDKIKLLIAANDGRAESRVFRPSTVASRSSVWMDGEIVPANDKRAHSYGARVSETHKIRYDTH